MSQSSKEYQVTMKSVHTHFFNKVDSAELMLDPFPHFYVQDVFPSDFYQRLLDSLPADSSYQTYPPPYEARLFINVAADDVAALPQDVRPFWVDFEAWMNSQEFLDGMAAKFADLLPTVYEHRKELIKTATGSDGRVNVAPRTLLARDYAHFALGPHTDAANKFITALFYLPRKDEFRQFGTSIYRPKVEGFRSWKSDHHPHEKFDLIRTFDNVPNSLFVFMKTDDSFHGVQPGDYPNVGRDLMLWFPEMRKKRDSARPLSLPRELLEPKQERRGFFRSLVQRKSA